MWEESPAFLGSRLLLAEVLSFPFDFVFEVLLSSWFFSLLLLGERFWLLPRVLRRFTGLKLRR
jgi:hypothetical protein